MFFFFSSRRRHTRLQGDWSSDVCSSDLGRRNDLGILSHGQNVEAHGPDQNRHERDDVRKDRPLDEKGGDHDRGAPCSGFPCALSRSGVTCRPGAAFTSPLTTTHSCPWRPSSIARSASTAGPVLTPRRSTTFLSFTTNT